MAHAGGCASWRVHATSGTSPFPPNNPSARRWSGRRGTGNIAGRRPRVHCPAPGVSRARPARPAARPGPGRAWEQRRRDAPSSPRVCTSRRRSSRNALSQDPVGVPRRAVLTPYFAPVDMKPGQSYLDQVLGPVRVPTREQAGRPRHPAAVRRHVLEEVRVPIAHGQPSLSVISTLDVLGEHRDRLHATWQGRRHPAAARSDVCPAEPALKGSAGNSMRGGGPRPDCHPFISNDARGSPGVASVQKSPHAGHRQVCGGGHERSSAPRPTGRHTLVRDGTPYLSRTTQPDQRPVKNPAAQIAASGIARAR